MKERPIIFNAEMVRAIRDGRKTQTRRVVKRLIGTTVQGVYHRPDGRFVGTHLPVGIGVGVTDPFPCPYCKPGDRLWVRETWVIVDSAGREFPRKGLPNGLWPIEGYELRYRATDEDPDPTTNVGLAPCRGRWKPSIHMPRWASRITLEVTGVRVERVQDIGERDAFAEGGDSLPDRGDGSWVRRFAWLWNEINAERGYGWDMNPWVWVVEFRKVSLGR